MTTQTLMILGASPLAVVAALLNRDGLLADFPRRDELARLQPHEYCPMTFYTELCDYLENRLGGYAFMRVGRRMGATVIATAFPSHVKTVEAALAQVQAAHQVFCRPVVGAFELTQRIPGYCIVRYTAPYNCTLQEGALYELASHFGAANATVTHAQCRRKGADACIFEVKY